MVSTNLSRFPGPRTVPVDIYQDESRASVWEQAFFIIWMFALYLPLNEFALLRYACLAGMLVLFVLHHRETLPILRKSWPLLPYPVLGLFSVFWSDYPSDALRAAILLLLTPILMVTIAVRLRPSEFLRVMMLSGALAAVYCIPYFSTLQYGGPLPQKNFLAYQFMIVTLIALATALNHKELPVFRLIAFATVPLAFVIQLVANSATALVFVVIGSAVLLVVKVFWVSAGSVAHLRSATLAMIVGAALAIALVILSLPQNSIIRDFLELVGKDPTLTGRTGIWNVAEMVSAQHPWLGVGLEGFWQPNVGLAQTLNELNHSAPGSKISFHSAFWEARVSLGYAGLGCLILAMAWTGVRTLRLWLQDGSVINSAFLIFFCLITASTFTESYVAGTFSTIVAIFYVGAFSSFDIGARKLVGRTRLIEDPV